MIKQLAEDFNGYFSCIGENMEKYISVLITFVKESADSNRKKKPNAYSLRFIDSYRFMNRGLDDLVENLAEPGKSILDNVLIEKFYNPYHLCDNNIDQFKLLLREGIYSYEYMGVYLFL